MSAAGSTSVAPWAVLGTTSLAVFAVFLDTTVLFVAFAAIGADFPQVSPAGMSWVLNAYTIVFAATLIPAGRLADRIGRRRTFLGAVVLFTAASVLCGFAPSVEALIIARVLQAVGAAALVPASLALVLQTFPREKVPVAVAIWSAIGAVAGAFGPTLGALAVQHLSWRWAFYLNLPVGLLSFALGQRLLPEGRESKPGPIPDLLSVALLVAALGSMAWAFVESGEWGWLSVRFLSVVGASVVLLATFIVRSRRVANPLVDLKLFALPSFRLANAATLIFAMGFSAMFLGNVLFLTRVWGYSILRAGMVVSMGPFIVAVTAPLLGKLAGRIGQRSLLVPGGLVWGSGALLLLLTATVEPNYVTQYLPAIVLTALGVSLCLPQLSSASVQGLPPDSFGTGSAVNQAVRNLGGTLGVALVIAFTREETGAAAMGGFHATWLLMIGSGLTVSALSFFLPRKRSTALAVNTSIPDSDLTRSTT
ncbi:MAG: DHA2 family efflux MFS transporter permease subunit [Archangium sp.]|nr:DHA2 family efflux MFS transporter permease subunit [Archangium sp.]